MNNPLITPKTETWDAVWTSQYHREENSYYLEAERCGQRWHDIKQFIKARIPEGTKLRAIEIGAGRGTVSCLLHQELGAEVSLLDFSDEALRISRDFFHHMRAPARFIKGDALALPDELIHQFDIVYSGGLIEHFQDDRQIIDAHFKAAKPGGFVIINAPNAWCIPYRIYKFWAELFNKFEVGFERPVNYFKLKNIATSRHITDYSISGSALLQTHSDWFTYFFRPIKKLIYLALRLKYVETCRQVKQFKPERRSKLAQLGTVSLNIIMQLKL